MGEGAKVTASVTFPGLRLTHFDMPALGEGPLLAFPSRTKAIGSIGGYRLKIYN